MPQRAEHPNYELLEVCGRGGMGVVYRARDKRLGRVVALKFLGPSQADWPGASARFKREAHAIAQLSHPNIAVVYEIGEWEGEPFLAFEYLPGGTLRDRIRGRRAPLDEILRVAMQLGAGLDFTHRRGILHRDIKPANCMFSALGDLKLVDFGLAKLAEGTELTRPGAALGTMPYMAPEFLNGEPASTRSDVYSFGALLYELAAGRPMYSAPSAEALCRKVLNDPPEPLSSIRPDLPSYVTEAVEHATARNPKDRPATVADVLAELRIPLKGSTPDSMLPTQTMAAPVVRRRNALRAIIATVLALLAGVAILWSLHLGPFARVPLANQTVVVLPFENSGSDPAAQTLTDGLQETITNIVSQAGSPQNGLLVVPSAEVRRDQVKTTADARRLFNATLAISGSVHKNAAGLEVSLALTDARTDQVKTSTAIPLSPDGPGLEKGLTGGLAKLFGGALPREKQAQAGQGTANASAYALFVQGQGALDGRNYGEAVKLFQQAVDSDPGFTRARARLALAHLRSYMQTKDRVSLAKGDEEASRAAQGGVTPDVLLVQALIRDATGDADQSLALFRQYLQADPNDVEAYGLLADALSKAGRKQEAEQTFEKAIRLRPGYWPTYQRLGVFYLNEHEFDKSEHSFLTAIQLAPDSPALHYNLGALYFDESRWDAAQVEFEKSLNLRPNALGYSNLGTVLFFQGKYEDAAKQFDQATKLQPNNPLNWGNRGDALWQLPGERDHAREAFQKAALLVEEQLSLDPANDQRKNYSLYLAKLGRNKDAVEQITQAMNREPNNADVWYWGARVYVLVGMSPKALEALKKAVSFGYDVSEIKREPDFAALRQDPAFEQIAAGSVKSSR